MIRGNKRPPEQAEKINVDIPMNIHNRFDFEVIDASTGEVKQRAQAENVICNQLWTKLFTPDTYFNYIHYGTGSGTPSAADTSLFAFSGAAAPNTETNVYKSFPSGRYASSRKQIRLSETTSVGAVLTEVGIGYGPQASTLCTHAMLKDMNGNPISIAKTDTDIINIYATMFAHWGISYDNNCIHVISDTAKCNGYQGGYGKGLAMYFLGYLLGDYRSDYYSYGQPPIYGFPAKGFYGVLSDSNTIQPIINLTPAYSQSSKAITLTARLPVEKYNIAGGINCIILSAARGTIEYFADIMLDVGGAWYSGSLIKAEAIGTGDGIAADFPVAFDFPTNATVYLNGVAQSAGVSVAPEPIKYTDMGLYFIHLDPESTVGDHICGNCGGLLSDSLQAMGMYSYKKSFIYYNPCYQAGIASFMSTNASVAVSNDLLNWTTISTVTATSATLINVSKAYQNYKYWKISATEGSTYVGSITKLIAQPEHTGKAIHFTTPPAAGAVITADYTTKTIAKDANHVFDLTVTITLGEKTV